MRGDGELPAGCATRKEMASLPAPALFAELVDVSFEFGGSGGRDRAAQKVDERAK
jgi:hypothetical protein